MMVKDGVMLNEPLDQTSSSWDWPMLAHRTDAGSLRWRCLSCLSLRVGRQECELGQCYQFSAFLTWQPEMPTFILWLNGCGQSIFMNKLKKKQHSFNEHSVWRKCHQVFTSTGKYWQTSWSIEPIPTNVSIINWPSQRNIVAASLVVDHYHPLFVW